MQLLFIYLFIHGLLKNWNERLKADMYSSIKIVIKNVETGFFFYNTRV